MPDAATTPRDWGCVNVRFLWKHRHVHPMIRERLRWWIDYARTASTSREEQLEQALDRFPFRRFELTIAVYVPRGAPLPETFADWIERAGFECHIASSTRLERVVETRYPLAADVVDKRSESDGKGPWW